MAIEGVTGAAATYQAAPQVTKVEKPEAARTVSGFSGAEGSVSEISKDTRIVENANNSSLDSNTDGKGRQMSEETMKQTLSDINKKLSNTEIMTRTPVSTRNILKILVELAPLHLCTPTPFARRLKVAMDINI